MSHPRFLPNKDTWRRAENNKCEQTKLWPPVSVSIDIRAIAKENIISNGFKRPIGYERDICRQFFPQLHNSSLKVEQLHISPKENYRREKKMSRKPLNECGFCKNNGHDFAHILKDELNRVVCPRLRKYICPKCRQTGDNAHTIKYCPMI